MASLVWVVQLSDGAVRVAVAPTGAIYRDVNQTHVQALQSVLDQSASRRVSELEDLYTAVQDHEQQRLAAARYRESVDEQWERMGKQEGYVLLRALKPGQLASDYAITANLVIAQQSAEYDTTFRSFVSRDVAVPTQNSTEKNLDVSGAAAFEVMDGIPADMFYYNGDKVSSWSTSAPSVRLHDLLGPNDEFADRSRFSRELLSKSTVPLRVHTTATGAAKRKSMDDDSGPYGGRARQWEFDAQNKSLNEHLRELHQVVNAVSAGLVPESSRVAETFVVVDADDPDLITELHRHNSGEPGEWRSYYDNKDRKDGAMQLQYKPRSGKHSWQLVVYGDDGSPTITHDSTVNELAWNASTCRPLQGCHFAAANASGYFVYAAPPKHLWLTKSDTLYTQTSQRRWGRPGGTYIDVLYHSQLHCQSQLCTATLQLTSPVDIIELDPDEVIMGQSQSSDAYAGLMSTTDRLDSRTDRTLFSAYPFQETMEPENDFRKRVWAGFKAELSRLSGIAMAPADTVTGHPLTNACYELKQAPELGGDAPVLHMSNGVDHWSIGSNATIAGDAIVASLIYVRQLHHEADDAW
ncbi:MAG: hypothetical protein ACPGR8_01255 [Limisphaerales bacterium]